MKPWRRVGSERLQRCRVFDVEEVRFEPPDESPAESFYCIRAPDWINVVPLTSRGEVLLLRQFRFGLEEITLEIPGGMCDPGETPIDAAGRELLEETGHEASELIELGWVHPNPSLQGNRCYTYLAPDVRPVGPPQPDAHESFELVRAPLDEIPRLIRERRITHALVLAAFHLFELSRSSGTKS